MFLYIFNLAEDGVSMNITSWDPSCVHRVAKEIKKLCTELEVPTPNSLTMLDVCIYLQFYLIILT